MAGCQSQFGSPFVFVISSCLKLVTSLDAGNFCCYCFNCFVMTMGVIFLAVIG